MGQACPKTIVKTMAAQYAKLRERTNARAKLDEELLPEWREAEIFECMYVNVTLPLNCRVPLAPTPSSARSALDGVYGRVVPVCVALTRVLQVLSQCGSRAAVHVAPV
jgi:hypothetical protein